LPVHGISWWVGCRRRRRNLWWAFVTFWAGAWRWSWRWRGSARSWCRRETTLRPPQIIPLNPYLLTEVEGAPFWLLKNLILKIDFWKLTSKNGLPKNGLRKMDFRKYTSEK
jgi:hypothetical protein